MQEVFVGVLFTGALVYLGSFLFKATKREGGCASNCNCGSKASTAPSLKSTVKLPGS